MRRQARHGLGDARSQMRSHSVIGFRPAGRVPKRSHTRAITPRDGQHKYSGLPASVGSAQQHTNLLQSKEESRPQLSQCGTPHRYECHKRSLFCRRSRRCDVFEPPSGSKSVRSAAVRHGGELASSLLCDSDTVARRRRRRLTRAVVLLRSQISQLAGLTRVSRSCSSRARPAAGGCAPAARRSAGATG